MSIIKKLFNLQVHGSYRYNELLKPCRESGNHVLDSFLSRLAFKLSDLVSLKVLYEEGHIFLGFTKDGQFVLSYTLVDNPNVAHEPLFKSDAYVLHFWLFVPSKALQKVGEVQLFGSELTSDLVSCGLKIAVCQWATEHQRILVYGCNHDQWNQPCNEEVECFITVAPVPSIQYCAKCSKLSKEFKERSSSSDQKSKKRLCLQHSFVVHLHYHLLPPFPPFIPKMCLNLSDGIVVFNTGDAICALTVSVLDNYKLQSSNLQNQKSSENKIQVQNSKTSLAKFKSAKLAQYNENDNKKVKCGSKNPNYFESKENIVPEKPSGAYNCEPKVIDHHKHPITSKLSTLELSNHQLIYIQEEDLEGEDDFCSGEEDIIYKNHLSLEVCGSHNTRMIVLPKSKAGSWNKECICVKHQICQVERFVNSIVDKLCSSSPQNKSLIFLDYYTQILDVCPVSESVFIIVQLLFESKVGLAKHSFSWYKCSFCFQWKPSDESCVLVHSSTLQEVNSIEKDRIRRNGPHFDPELLSLHTKYMQSMRPMPLYMQSVKVLTNEAVLKNESLKVICEPYHGIALIL